MFFYLMTLDLLIAFQHLSLPLLANDSFSLQSSEKGISYLTNYREIKLVFLNHQRWRTLKRITVPSVEVVFLAAQDNSRSSKD